MSPLNHRSSTGEDVKMVAFGRIWLISTGKLLLGSFILTSFGMLFAFSHFALQNSLYTSTSNMKKLVKDGYDPTANAKFTADPGRLANTDDEFMHLAVLARGVHRSTIEGYKLRLQLRKMLVSLFIRTILKPVHLIVITDPESVEYIRELFIEAHPPFRLYNVLKDKNDPFGGNRTEVDRFQLEFVDIGPIMAKVKEWNKTMKELFNNHGGKYIVSFHDEEAEEKTSKLLITLAEKYNDDIYYICPFYHKIFPTLPKIMVVDADVEFRVDLSEIYSVFDKFEGDEVIAVGNDLAPHYYQMLTSYRETHPDTELGKPGRFQGFNVGVLMYDLAKLRASRLYNNFLSSGETTRIAVKYGLTSTHLGEQDWLTLVGWEAPQLIHPLNCLYNRQLGRDYETGPWKKMFAAYHDCEEVLGEEPYIVHGNSDSNI